MSNTIINAIKEHQRLEKCSTMPTGVTAMKLIPHLTFKENLNPTSFKKN